MTFLKPQKGVGKSSLIRRYVDGIFMENNTQTIGVDLFTKTVDVETSSVTLQIWDTGGQERFRALRTPFYRGSGQGQSNVYLTLWCRRTFFLKPTLSRLCYSGL